jgi:hypothetical protein
MSRPEPLRCPPYDATPVDVDGAGIPIVSILELASIASDAAERYRSAMDERAPFRDTMISAGRLSAATRALTAAISDAVACGDNTLS